MIIHVNPADKNGNAVATPAEALAILRKATGEKKMIIHSGIYYGTSLALTEEDNGLIIEGSGQGRAVLSGGILVKNWRVDPKTGWFYTEIPKKDGKPVDFRLLLTEKGDYLKKARYPLEGELKHCTIFNKLQWRGSCFGGWGRMLKREELDNFVYDPKDFADDFVFENAEVQVYHSWNESYTNIVGMNRETNTFYVDPPCGHPPGAFRQQEYIIYNTAEGMAEDGRWYRDKKNGLIYYRPYPGETAEEFSTVVPLTYNVISFAEGCKNITIRDIEVTAATTPVVTDIFSTEVMRGAGGFVSLEQSGAIEGEGLSDILIEDVRIYKTGGLGIKLKGDGIYIRGAQIRDCGAGGVALTITTPIPDGASEALIAGWPCVENCHIEHIGVDYYSAAALFVDKAIARKNYIADTPYSGIVAYGDNIVIEENIVYDPMQKLDDGAAIYKLMDDRAVIRNNFVQKNDHVKVAISSKGLYLDAPGVDCEVYGNVVKGFYSPFHHHIGQPGTVWHDNFFVNNGDMLLTLNRSEGAHLVNNVFKCAGTLHFHAPLKAIAEFRGNVLRHGSDYVLYSETIFNDTDGKFRRTSQPPRPFEVDDTNSVERNLG